MWHFNARMVPLSGRCDWPGFLHCYHPFSAPSFGVMFLGTFPSPGRVVGWIRNSKSLNFFSWVRLIFFKATRKERCRTAGSCKENMEELWILPISVLLYMSRSKPHFFFKCLFCWGRFPVNKSFFRFIYFFFYRSKCKAFVAIETGEYSIGGIMGHDWSIWPAPVQLC